jgi:hypothetical protein
MSEFVWRERRAALLVAHPGHELRVFHWLEIARPLVCVLTDGSGHTNQSRLSSTTRILETTGTTEEVMQELAASFIEHGIEYVAHDAIQGYNPSHDLCWHLAGTTSLLASNTIGRTIRMFDFPLTGRPDACPKELRDKSLFVALDDAALQRKLAAAEGYPELKAEVDAAREKFGDALFATECLRPTANAAPHLEDTDEVPFYEKHGEARAASGYYADVIRRREHLLPLARRLWQTAAQTESCASF